MRLQIMGHASRKDVPGRYGPKQRLTTRDLKLLVATTSPVIDELTEMLMGPKQRADAGELHTPKPWLLQHNWSTYYQRKLRVGQGGK